MFVSLPDEICYLEVSLFNYIFQKRERGISLIGASGEISAEHAKPKK